MDFQLRNQRLTKAQLRRLCSDKILSQLKPGLNEDQLTKSLIATFVGKGGLTENQVKQLVRDLKPQVKRQLQLPLTPQATAQGAKSNRRADALANQILDHASKV